MNGEKQSWAASVKARERRGERKIKQQKVMFEK
jgi:hypothetical protein